MLDLAKEFATLGFAAEEEDKDTILYTMDFSDETYIIVTDDNGNTPERAKQNLIIACYDSQGNYLWGSECKTFMDLQKLCEGRQPGSIELLTALKNASKTLKDTEWSTPFHP